ncbi:chalcone isomerase family protein [Aliidiomarina indica]|uniref:hypothetical protein n=1 Tax=Aliidiomarina indica TaxID=2749147 RepID=UPI00188E4201|nr:hypothetical protein [Aliidiomarina indica]
MARFISLLTPFIFAAGSVVASPAASDLGPCAEKLWEDGDTQVEFHKVGETRLRVMFFRIYDAALYSDTGDYEDAQALALKINYARSFSASDLVEQTRDEWERMGYSIDAQKQEWLETLSGIWPDVGRGECIVAHTFGNGQTFFHGQQGFLGVIDAEEFAERFLGIWLSEDARFRSNRDELVGISD